jgi:hypothetical protein
VTEAAGAPDPHWPREAVGAILHELRGYARAAWAMARAPARFSAGWARGEVRALNPLACILNALAISGPWRALWVRLLHIDVVAPLWVDVAKPLLPAVGLTFLGGGAHLILRLFGRVRPLRTTLGITLYVNAGPMTALGFVSRPLAEAALVGRVSAFGQLASVVALVVFAVYLVVGLAAAHGVRRRRVVVAVIVIIASWMAVWIAITRLMPGLVKAMLT